MNLDVEKLFSDFVEDYGGVVVDRLPNKGNKELKADFIFHDARVIAELKLLKNPFGNKAFNTSLESMKRDWIRKGWITWKELQRITLLRELPQNCRLQANTLYTRSVVNGVKTANKQIRSTKATFDLDYKGWLIVVSDGNYLLGPAKVRDTLANTFSNPNEFKSINSVSYLTVNTVVTRPDHEPLPCRLWTNLYRDADRMENEVPLNFLDDICDKWGTYFGLVTGLIINKVDETNDRGLSEIDYLRETTFVEI